MANVHISWSVNVILSFVVVHKHLFDVYLSFHDDTRFALSLLDVLSHQPKHCKLHIQHFAIYYRGNLLNIKAAPNNFTVGLMWKLYSRVKIN